MMSMSMMTMMMILNIDDDGDNSDDSDTCQTDGSIEYGQNMQWLGSQQMCWQCAINHNVIKTMCQSLETSNAIISMYHPFLVMEMQKKITFKMGNLFSKHAFHLRRWKSPSLWLFCILFKTANNLKTWQFSNFKLQITFKSANNLKTWQTIFQAPRPTYLRIRFRLLTLRYSRTISFA